MNLEHRHRLLKELFEHATESIIVINKVGIIKLINPAAEKLFGYAQAELVEKKVEYLIPDRNRKNHVSHRERYNQNPHTRAMGIGMDLYARKKDSSEFPVEISLSPFESDGKQFVIAFIIDITRRKLVELEIINHQKQLESMTQQLKATNEKLEIKVLDRTKVLQEALTEIEKSRVELRKALKKEKELNELKSRFLSMASHEFRTPLTTILSSASLIPDYPSLEQQGKRLKHVERIKSAVNNLTAILNDFLSFSKIEEGKVIAEFKTFNLKKLIEEVRNDMKGICKEGQEITYTHMGGEEILLDPMLMRNVIINLVSNAIKFSDENKKVYLKSSVDKKGIMIEVKDEGIGISKEDQEHLFERFFRGHNVTNIQGTGLGLNIVANYVELMDGYIEIESDLENGTSCRITFSKNINRN